MQPSAPLAPGCKKAVPRRRSAVGSRCSSAPASCRILPISVSLLRRPRASTKNFSKPGVLLTTHPEAKDGNLIIADEEPVKASLTALFKRPDVEVDRALRASLRASARTSPR